MPGRPVQATEPVYPVARPMPALRRVVVTDAVAFNGSLQRPPAYRLYPAGEMRTTVVRCRLPAVGASRLHDFTDGA